MKATPKVFNPSLNRGFLPTAALLALSFVLVPPVCAEHETGVTLYEHRSAHHDHLICVGCGEIVEFECSLIEKAQLDIAKQYGYRLTNHRHYLYGYCTRCQKPGKRDG